MVKNKIKIYGISNCDTMKKAFVWLDSNKVPYDFHNYKIEGISTEKLSAWMKVHPWDKVLNKNGSTYKLLDEAGKASINDAEKAISFLLENTSGIKRPLIETQGEILIGFDPEKYAKVLL